MPFLKEEGSSDIGAFIAISLLIATSFLNLKTGNTPYILIPVFFIALSGILIFFWWKHKLTETYLTKLKDREIGALQKEITELKEYNEISSKIIHKDNKAVPAMYFEVQHVLTELYDRLSPKDRELLTTTLARIEPLVSERKGILQFSDAKAKSVYLTGALAIDTLLKYQAYKAYAEQINFEVMTTANVQMIVPDILSEADFRTLVADLVDNALNAVKYESKRNVLFHTRTHENIFYVDIYDSGAPFAKEVLEKMGKERITTHQHDGGSGIGYMSTFEILKRCNGTLHIDEHLDMETYTKKVSIGIPLNYDSDMDC